MEIYELKKGDEREWDEFILKTENSNFYDQIGWKNLVEKTYRHRSCYLMAKENDDIIGTLPLFLMKSKIFGRKIVSVPYAPYGGVCADNSEVEDALVEEAMTIAKEKDMDYLEVRCLSGNKSALITNYNYLTLVLKLEKDPEFLWKNFSRKVRNAVRKGIKSDLMVSNNHHVRDFYQVYSKNMRDLGAPVHDYTFFKNLSLEFPKQTRIITAQHEGRVIGGIFLLYFRNTIISGWASSDRSYQRLNPNNLIYWEAIKHGCEKGYEYFDFGRSTAGSGTYHFKRPWGTELKQLYYKYYLNNAKEIPDTCQINPKRRMFANLWKKLPVLLTERIGPKLRREFP